MVLLSIWFCSVSVRDVVLFCVFRQLEVNSLLRFLGFGWFLLGFLCREMVLISSLEGCLEGFVSIYFDIFSRLCSIIGLGFVLLGESFKSMAFISCMNFGQSWGPCWSSLEISYWLFSPFLLSDFGRFGNRFCLYVAFNYFSGFWIGNVSCMFYS